jgi:AcrR family transcriptional regulator
MMKRAGAGKVSAQAHGTSEPSAADAPAERILREAGRQLFARGYNALTMDALAHELGMSKKTVYTYFDSKDEIIAAVIDDAGRSIRHAVSAALDDPDLSFMSKLRQVVMIVGTHWERVTPTMLREFKRFAPVLYRQLEELKQHNIPLVIGRLLRQGKAKGKVRDDVDPEFAAQFWLQSLNGLLDPTTLETLALTPREAFEKGVRLFFWAVMSEAGRADFLQSEAPR